MIGNIDNIAGNEKVIAAKENVKVTHIQDLSCIMFLL